ncbi:hypothetical protein M422DRAFT_33150, partial [Sphaerobolus stellatus SS14]
MLFNNPLDYFLLILGCTIVLAIPLINRRKRSPAIYPPGPKGHWLLGNVSDMPKEHEWETYTRWAKEHGDLVYIKVLRQPIVFVNSMTIAYELFERRSSIYSDRFDFPMLGELMGFDWNFVIMRYGDRWRRHRRSFHQRFNPGAILEYMPLQLNQTRSLLLRLRESPDDFLAHIRHLSGAVTMDIIYGIKVQPKDDPYLKLAEDGFAVASEAANPGSFLVDTLPILKYVPEWMPGAGFKTKARNARKLSTAMAVVPFTVCKNALEAGKASPSFTASSLSRLASQTTDDVEEDETIIRNTAATGYGAGADTTTVALHWWILAMILYPEVQARAQEELDRVLGDRLPTFDDLDQLPYITAMCKEVQRFHPVFPLGIAHGTVRDDVYKGYLIPKGSVVIGNAWAMLHDEKVYGANVNDFDPGRFLKAGVPDPIVAFGFGR